MRQFEPRVGIRTSSFGSQPGPLDLEVRRHNSATGISLSALGSFQAAPDLGAADDLPQRQRHFLPQPPGRAFATLLDRRYHLDVSHGVAPWCSPGTWKNALSGGSAILRRATWGGVN